MGTPESPYSKLSNFISTRQQSNSLKDLIDLRAVFRDVQLAGLPQISMIKYGGNRSPKQIQNDLTATMNRFIWNIHEQKLHFQGWTWKAILDLFTTVCTNINKSELDERLRYDELRIEILYSYSIIDADEYYSTRFAAIKNSFSKNEAFERELLYVVRDLAAYDEIELAERGYESVLKQRLKSNCMVQAVEKVLKEKWEGVNELFRASFTPEWIKSAIDQMKIYVSHHHWGNLRGTIVKDGIVIFTDTLAAAGGAILIRSDADVVSLGGYLIGHYLPRKLMDDFSAVTTMSKNLGAEIEKELFDGVIPEWHLIEVEKAEEFLGRIQKPEWRLPVYGAGERNGIRTREVVLVSSVGQLMNPRRVR